MTNLKHDNYFRYVFSDVERMAELLNLLASNNKRLAEFLDTIDIDSLTEISESFSDVNTYGYADLAFTVKLNQEKHKDAELLVGILAEHKSAKNDDVIKQLVEYWFQIMVKKQKNIPTVAIIVYNGKEPWNPNMQTMFADYPEYYKQIGLPFICEFVDVGNILVQDDLLKLTPKTMLALVALKYVFHRNIHKNRFKSAVKAFMKLSPKERGNFFDKTMLYLKEIIPQNEKEEYMDFIDVPKYYGYKSIAQAEREEWMEKIAKSEASGFVQGRAEGSVNKAREMAKAMLLDGLPIAKVAAYSGLSEAEIKSL